jgi:hypothetical protein
VRSVFYADSYMLIFICWGSYVLCVFCAECLKCWVSSVCWVSCMLSVLYADCLVCWVSYMLSVLCAECLISWVSIMLSVTSTLNTDCFSVERHCAKCRNAECRGALLWNTFQGNLAKRGRLSTVDLLALTSLDHMLFILKILFTFLRNKLA